MRHSLLALSFASSIFPALAFAAPADVPCNLVDREALIALKLGDSKMKTEHKTIPAAEGSPMQKLDTCTISPPNLPLPSLTVSIATLPTNAKQDSLSCTGQSVPVAAVEIATCNATVKNTFVTFAMVTKGSSDAAMQAALRSQVERLVKRLSGSGPQGTPGK